MIMVDTLKYFERLKKTNIPDEAAKEIAEMFRESTAEISAELATKADLKLEIEIVRRDMKELELRLKHDLTLRLGAMITAAIAIVAALVKLL